MSTMGDTLRGGGGGGGGAPKCAFFLCYFDVSFYVLINIRLYIYLYLLSIRGLHNVVKAVAHNYYKLLHLTYKKTVVAIDYHGSTTTRGLTHLASIATTISFVWK
jgi:hypothetical protein